MIKNFEKLSIQTRERVKEIHSHQMSAFGGEKPEYQLKEVFKKDNMLCVRFKNGDWYHYLLAHGTWF